MAKKVIIITLIIALVGWFYWFQYRPAKIRSYCDWRTKGESYWRITKNYDARYEACLHEKGFR